MPAKRKFDIPKLKLKVARSRAGLGIFALQDIPKGTCIIEYKGRRITEKQVDASRSKYLFDAGKNYTIDGQSRSNKARYINHSCRPNCEVDIWRHHVYILSKRKIEAGEELCYSYGKDYFDTFLKEPGCRCLKCKPPKRGERVRIEV